MQCKLIINFQYVFVGVFNGDEVSFCGPTTRALEMCLGEVCLKLLIKVANGPAALATSKRCPVGPSIPCNISSNH